VKDLVLLGAALWCLGAVALGTMWTWVASRCRSSAGPPDDPARDAHVDPVVDSGSPALRLIE